jgi:DNA-binding transcriptional ArsR family regulator
MYTDELDLVFKALADPTRRLIVERLSDGPASVSTLAAPLPMSMPAVHQHLQVLQASGLVQSEKIGRVRTFRLELTMLNTAEKWVHARRVTWERRLDRLDSYLASLPPENPDESGPTKGKSR